MNKRLLITAIAAIGIASSSLFAQQNASVKVGDVIRLRLTNEVATAWYEHIDAPGPLPGLQIETNATIAETLDDGRVLVIMTWGDPRDAKQHPLATLTTSTDRSKLVPYSPGKAATTSSRERQRDPRISKSNPTTQPKLLLKLSSRDDVSFGRSAVETKTSD